MDSYARDTRFFLSLRLPPEGPLLKWQRGGGRQAGLVEVLISYGGSRKEEERRRRGCDPGKRDGVLLSYVLLSFLKNKNPLYAVLPFP